MNEEIIVEGTEDYPDRAVELARNFGIANHYTSVTSTLMYGVQWDAVMQWIDPAYKDENCDLANSYVANSIGKGYYTPSEPEAPTETGYYAVNNIYDLAGNVYEWTMESYGTGSRINRGGNYYSTGVIYPASSRNANIPSIRDMYSGGFYPFQTLEEYWAWWSRHIMVNRYERAPKPVYDDLLKLVDGKDYFVLTTNVDHQFQLADFDKKRLFYTQGDYGLWQCSKPCHQETYDNEDTVRRMAAEQMNMKVPSELVPRCPKCGRPMTMNLRCDDTFVQDKGWYQAASRYEDFLRRHEHGRVIYLELGVGANTPVIIKYPFWKMTALNPDALYVCINSGEAFAPKEIAARSLCFAEDIGAVIGYVLAE